MTSAPLARTTQARRDARQQRGWANRTRMFTERISRAQCAHDKLAAACDLMRAAALQRTCDEIESLATDMVSRAYEVNDR